MKAYFPLRSLFLGGIAVLCALAMGFVLGQLFHGREDLGDVPSALESGTPGVDPVPSFVQVQAVTEDSGSEPPPLHSLVPVWRAPSVPPQPDPVVPAWRRHAVPSPAWDGRAQVVIIIDDLGLDRRRTARIMDLPAPLTLAFLPYAEDLPSYSRTAREAGHEIMIHVPMEPLNGDIDPGPAYLRTGQTEEDFVQSLETMLRAVPAPVAVNNHMGSRFTQDPEGMARLMRRVKDHGLGFVDSRTTPDSVAQAAATALFVPFASRDVFLDHESGEDFVRNALEELERIAKKRGYAIAIGHPKDDTIAVLSEWIPTLPDKNIVLVPVSSVLSRP